MANIKRSWIIVRHIHSGRWFHDHADQRELYRRDRDFAVQAGTWPTRREAREEIRRLKRKEKLS